MAKRRRDLRGVSDEKMLTWSHHLDQMDALRTQALKKAKIKNMGPQYPNKVPRSSRKWRKRDIEQISSIAYDDMYRAVRNPNVSHRQFREVASRAVGEASWRMGMSPDRPYEGFED